MQEGKKPVSVEISHRTIIFTAVLILSLWFLFLIREIILLIFLSIILVSALLKPVEWLHARRIPRAIAVLIVYLVVISVISVTLSIIIPPLVSQTGGFINNLPRIIGTINDFLVFNKIPVDEISKVLTTQINAIAGNVVSISTAIFSSIFLLITLFVLSFYLLLEWRMVTKLFASAFNAKQEKRTTSLISDVERSLGAWVRGQLTLSLIIGVASYVGLTILGIPFALPLALVAGILEVIPLLGPIVSAIPAVLVGLTVSPVLGLAVVALFFIIQQLENHIVVPMVMSKVVGLQPALVIISLLIGSTLNGVAGAFLAVPVMLVIKIVLKDLLGEEQESINN